MLALAGLAISFVLPTFAQQKDAVDPKTEQQIRALTSNFDAAFNRNDAAAVAALYTANGVSVFHQTSYGRQAIEKSYAHDFQRWHPNNHIISVNHVILAGNDVRAIGKWSCVFQNTTGGPGNDGGHCSWVIVREGDTWKIRRHSESGTGSSFSTN